MYWTFRKGLGLKTLKFTLEKNFGKVNLEVEKESFKFFHKF